MAEPKIVKKCRALVKDKRGTATVCDKTLKGECPNRREHVRTSMTGFCGIGAHEGSRTETPGGKKLKTCAEWKYCPCDCHKMYDQMYSMSEMDRVVVDNSGYSPPHNTYWVPTLEERVALSASSNSVGMIAPVVIESPLPDSVPTTTRRSFAPTPTGRSARGELESWTKDVCDEYLVENYKAPCTPMYVAEQIGKNEGIKPPSSGAVNAVFERWIKMGFAIIEKKPTRFVGYTTAGIELGLDVLKLKIKMAAKSEQSNANRGIRV